MTTVKVLVFADANAAQRGNDPMATPTVNTVAELRNSVAENEAAGHFVAFEVNGKVVTNQQEAENSLLEE